MRGGYYRERLSGFRLFRCYEVASERIRRYLRAEVDFVVSNVGGAGLVLELGCGYGRVMKRVSEFVGWVVGNDVSGESLDFAMGYMGGCGNYSVFLMDACRTGFGSGVFDVVFCVQNGISAFGVDRRRLVGEAVRVVKDGGVVLFSSYSPKIWEARLEWFRRQSLFGLVGEIDEERTCDGTIVCRDGFRATTVGGDEFVDLFGDLGLDGSIIEVDESSVFCRVVKKKR